jgi:hypothetical protein
MFSIMLLALFAVPAVFTTACGGGGGTSTPDDIGNSVMKIIKTKDLKDWDKLIKMCYPIWEDAGKQDIAERKWKMENSRLRWKEDVKPDVEKMDPKGKSEIDSEDKYKAMEAGRWYALQTGAYTLAEKEDWEKRMSEVDWWMTGRDVKLDVEGQGRASLSYGNQYGDSIVVHAARIDGKWYLAAVDLKGVPKDLPEKKK